MELKYILLSVEIFLSRIKYERGKNCETPWRRVVFNAYCSKNFTQVKRVTPGRNAVKIQLNVQLIGFSGQRTTIVGKLRLK